MHFLDANPLDGDLSTHSRYYLQIRTRFSRHTSI